MVELYYEVTIGYNPSDTSPRSQGRRSASSRASRASATVDQLARVFLQTSHFLTPTTFGFGRIVDLETEVPNILAYQV